MKIKVGLFLCIFLLCFQESKAQFHTIQNKPLRYKVNVSEQAEIVESVVNSATDESSELITKKKLIKSNKNEVEVLLSILGICGILSGADAPCYCDRFVDVWHRAPKEHTNDYAYPVNWWHVSDGVNEDRFLKVFGFRYSEL